MRLALLSLLTVGAVAGAQAFVLIDGFSDGHSTSFGGDAYFTNNPATDTFGTLSYRSATLTANPFFMSQNWTSNGAGKGFAEAGPGIEGTLTLIYAGGLTNGTNPFGGGSLMPNQFTPAGESLAGENQFILGYEDADQDFDVRFGMLDIANNVIEWSPYVTMTAGNGSVSAAFAGINTTNINLASVDGVAVQFNVTNSQDVTITRLAAVPEPASMLALGAGLAALAARRRKGGN